MCSLSYWYITFCSSLTLREILSGNNIVNCEMNTVNNVTSDLPFPDDNYQRHEELINPFECDHMSNHSIIVCSNSDIVNCETSNTVNNVLLSEVHTEEDIVNCVTNNTVNNVQMWEVLTNDNNIVNCEMNTVNNVTSDLPFLDSNMERRKELINPFECDHSFNDSVISSNSDIVNCETTNTVNNVLMSIFALQPNHIPKFPWVYDLKVMDNMKGNFKNVYVHMNICFARSYSITYK